MEHLEEKSPEKVTQEKPIIIKTTWPKAFSSVMGKFIITVGTIIILSIVFIQINKLIDKTSKVAIEIASAFKTGKIKTEFIEYASMIDMTNHLQIATLKCIDNFSEQDSRSILILFLYLM